jgi:hypothetical protein
MKQLIVFFVYLSFARVQAQILLKSHCRNHISVLTAPRMQDEHRFRGEALAVNTFRSISEAGWSLYLRIPGFFYADPVTGDTLFPGTLWRGSGIRPKTT